MNRIICVIKTNDSLGYWTLMGSLLLVWIVSRRSKIYGKRSFPFVVRDLLTNKCPDPIPFMFHLYPVGHHGLSFFHNPVFCLPPYSFTVSSDEFSSGFPSWTLLD